MLNKTKQNYIFYSMIVALTLFATLAHLGVTFKVLLYLIVIATPLVLDDTKTISLYLYSVCFMACFGPSGFLIALNVSLLILEIKKLIIAFKTKQDLQNIKKIFIVWFSLLLILTMYSLIVNHFKVRRMGMFIDFIQCILVCYLVRKNINIKHVLFALFAGIVTSASIASCFNLLNISNPLIAGHINGRFGGFFNNVNALSAYCTLCASCFIVLILTNKLKFQYYFYFPIITTCFGLLPYSKAFILVNILLYIAWFVISFIKSSHKKRYVAYAGVLVIVGLIVAFIGRDYISSIIDRFTSTNHATTIDNFTTGRADIWKQYIDRWLKNPLTFLFGNGYTAPKIPSKRYEHSIYIAFLYQFGVVGTAIILGALVWTLRKNLKLQRCVVYYIPLTLLLINGFASNLSGVLCTCLIWFVSFYFVSDTSTVKTNTLQIKTNIEPEDDVENKGDS